MQRTLPLILGAVLCGCATTRSVTPPRPAMVNHVAFISLADPADADALIADSNSLLSEIPSVVSYFAGGHVDSGRDNVVADYDVGLYVGFDSLEGYAEYVDHPNHIALVTKWRPRITSLVVRDVLDETE